MGPRRFSICGLGCTRFYVESENLHTYGEKDEAGDEEEGGHFPLEVVED